MRIDAHQHYWDPARGDYGWLTPDLQALWRRFAPADLEPLLAASGIDGTILVQAAPSAAETDYLLELARNHRSILGVVGWIDLAGPDACDRIEDREAEPLVVGIRPMLQDLPDPDWISNSAVAPALARLAKGRLVFDALIRVPQANSIAMLADREPELAIIVDHAAKPDIRSGGYQEWADTMRRLAGCPNIYCKLSGLMSEAPPGAEPAIFQDYANLLVELFGPARVLWGSDWPVLTAFADYEQWYALSAALLERLSVDERDAVLGGNATRVYGLGAR